MCFRNGIAIFVCESFIICYPGSMWSRSDLLPWKHWQRWFVYCYSRRVWPMMCDVLQREISNGGIKWTCQCCQCFSWFKLNLIHDNQHSQQGRLYFTHSVFQLTLLTKKTKNSQKFGKKMVDDRKFKSQKKFISNKLYNVLNVSYYFYFHKKLHIHHWRAACYFRDKRRGFKFGV